jgi:hypothetical protein
MSHIRLARYFRGRLTQEKLIPAGVYDEEDPRLMGLAEYLLETEHAVIVDDGLPMGIDEPKPDTESKAGFLTHEEVLALRGQSSFPDEDLPESSPEVEAPKRQTRRK